MLSRIEELMNDGTDFAFETTLASKSHTNRVRKSQEKGYHVTLIFLWLESIELAKERVKRRVVEGGHNIPEHVIERRYKNGLRNLFQLYSTECDSTLVFDNSKTNPIFVFETGKGENETIFDTYRFKKMKGQAHY